jgi:homogentisate 1,2-dioxygenase
VGLGPQWRQRHSQTHFQLDRILRNYALMDSMQSSFPELHSQHQGLLSSKDLRDRWSLLTIWNSSVHCRSKNQRSWLYRIRPSVQHDTFEPYTFNGFKHFRSGAFDTSTFVINPNQMRWSPRTALNTWLAIHTSMRFSGEYRLNLRKTLLPYFLPVPNRMRMESISWTV